MLGAEICAHLEALVAAERVETVEGRPFAPLVVFDSGARCGLQLGGEGAEWAVAQPASAGSGAKGEILAPFGQKGSRAFVEAIEQPRDAFDEALDRAARELGFGGDPISFSFPAVELVATVLGSRSAFLCRRALTWLLPTELRALRGQIAAVAADARLPGDLRDLARRLVVSE